MSTQPALDLQASKPTLRFDAVAHKYFLDPEGVELPGVTRALEGAGIVDWSMVPRDILVAAQERGTRVHEALHYLDDGELDEQNLDPAIQGYVSAWPKAKAQLDIEILLVEHMGFSAAHRYAGRMDRVVTLPKKGGGRRKSVIDFKTGIVLPGHAVQLALYVSLLPNPFEYDRICLQLSADGTYRVHEYPPETFQRDLAIGRAAVGIWHWKQSQGKRV